MDILAIYAAKILLLPPGLLLLLALFGILYSLRERTAGMSIALTALLLLLLCSLPVVGHYLARPLEHHAPITDADLPSVANAAIVVLGRGRYTEAPEYGGQDSASAGMLERLRYAAVLQRQSRLPLLVSGGMVAGEGRSEAAIMAAILEQEFSVPVTWQEDSSRNTAENARYSGRILHRHGIGTILLVTHALHMQRAAIQFRQQGLKVIPAPLAFTSHHPVGQSFFDWIPSLGGLTQTTMALHEYLGLLWYRLRYHSGNSPSTDR